MHYTSWDRTDRAHPRLLANEGPDVLATFSEDSAQLTSGATWQLFAEPKTHAVATLPTGEEFRIDGDLRRGKRLTVDLAGTTFTFVNEQASNWIIDDANDNKVAQFTGANNGVRKAIVEFAEPDTSLSADQAIALSWFARVILENRLNNAAVAIVASLVLCSLAAVITWLT